MLLWLPLANRGTGLKSNKTNFLACITVFNNVVPNQPLCSRWVRAVIISGDITVQLLGQMLGNRQLKGISEENQVEEDHARLPTFHPCLHIMQVRNTLLVGTVGRWSQSFDVDRIYDETGLHAYKFSAFEVRIPEPHSILGPAIPLIPIAHLCRQW